MALTKEQRAQREGRITGSFLTQLMKGNAEIITNTWRGLIGDPSYVEERVETWPFLFGSVVEPVALDYHEKKTQCELTRRGEVVVHPHRPYFCVTLDAFRVVDSTVIDCKAFSSFYSIENIVADYTPQLVGQVGCTGALNAALLIVHGGGEPQEIVVRIDSDYELLVWQRVDQFWWCVENLVPPIERPELIKPVIPPEQWRTINLDNDADRTAHNWSATIIEALDRWNAHKDAADAFDGAKADIKVVLPDDVARVKYSGLFVRRAKNNAITIGREKVA